jgi:hypothetical protein
MHTPQESMALADGCGGMKISPLSPPDVRSFIEDAVGTVLHEKQIDSLAHAVLGAMYADRAGVAAIGRAAARVRDVSEKHSIKQVDRLLSNEKVGAGAVQRLLARLIIGERKEIVVAIDWTSYEPDGHMTLAISLITEHGRATPLLWRTIELKKLKSRQTKLEAQLLWTLALVVPEDVRVTVLADRGFGSSYLFRLLSEKLKFDYVIRVRKDMIIEASDGEKATASEWTPTNGRARHLLDARITRRRHQVSAVVCVKRAGMKDSRCLVTSRKDAPEAIVQLYSRRFDIEHSFRDQKDRRFGFGLYHSRVGTPARRDRLLLVLVFAAVLLTMLGAAGERHGLDRSLRANTVKERRTHSLLRQGREYVLGVARAIAADVRCAFRDLCHGLRKNELIYAPL